LVAIATALEKTKKLNELNKPLHPFTNPEILVKIVPLATGSRKSTIKKMKKKYRQNI